VSTEVPKDAGQVTAGYGAASRIAGYRLEERIGSGGMAVVFRARDERLGRLVALKILAPGLAADDQFRQRFVRESRAAAAVDDPHIIPVFEAGEAEGVLFIAMRYVPGGDVRSLLRREGPLPLARVAAIVSPVASALDAAHAAGLVHRDVKPANMLLDARPGRPDHVYLADFGLSKGRSSAATLTGTGVSMGTPSYMAPEQIEGRPVDGRTDQYALACAAFELLAGQPPFARDLDQAVIYAQLTAPPPSLAGTRPDVPAGVDAVFARALAKAPDHRYPSCREFAEALRLALGLAPYDHDPGAPLDGHPPTELAVPPGTDPSGPTITTAVPPRAAPVPPGGESVPPGAASGPVPPDAPPWRRRRVRVIAAGIAVLAAAAITAGVVLPGAAPGRAASIAIAAGSGFHPVDGYTFVEYQSGQDGNARIYGQVTGAVSGEVAQLYAQPWPYRAAPAQAGAVILHPNGKTAPYSFQVTPEVATRYQVRLFASSTATTAAAASPVSTVYVTYAGKTVSENFPKTCGPVCHVTIVFRSTVPASTMSTEFAKKLYTYFGFNLDRKKDPPSPRWLLLGAGDPKVTMSRVSATEFSTTINFTYRIGDNYSTWNWDACSQDSLAEDGLGVPGHHGCGDQRIAASAYYLG
jgi:serine/threonine protein kinase